MCMFKFFFLWRWRCHMAVSWWGNIESNDSAGNVCGMYMYMYMYVHAFKRKGECHRSWQWLQVPHNSPKVHMGAATDIYAHVLSLITTIYRGKFLLLIFGACNFTHRLAIRHRRPMCIYFFFDTISTIIQPGNTLTIIRPLHTSCWRWCQTQNWNLDRSSKHNIEMLTLCAVFLQVLWDIWTISIRTVIVKETSRYWRETAALRTVSTVACTP